MSEDEAASPKDELADRATERDEKMRVYRKQYWERFHKTRKRVYGTLTSEEYERIERRAEEAGRAVWSQLHAEAEAYARGEYLPPKEIEERIRELIIQLRRIGSNVNQITRSYNAKGDCDEPELLQSLHELELLIRDFVRKPWGELPPDESAGS